MKYFLLPIGLIIASLIFSGLAIYEKIKVSSFFSKAHDSSLILQDGNYIFNPNGSIPVKNDNTFDCGNKINKDGGITLMAMGDGSHDYKEQEVSPGKCKLVEDKEAEKREAEEENRRRKLWYALQTRALTKKELSEVRAYGDSINIEPKVLYREEEKQRERDEAFLQQARLQAIKHGKILP